MLLAHLALLPRRLSSRAGCLLMVPKTTRERVVLLDAELTVELFYGLLALGGIREGF